MNFQITNAQSAGLHSLVAAAATFKKLFINFFEIFLRHFLNFFETF